jgi:HSP20 family protein
MTTSLTRKFADPFDREFVTLRDAVDRMFEGPFFFKPSSLARGFEAVLPQVDIEEKEGKYTLKATLPGWESKDVEIEYENGVITLKGEVKDEIEDKNKKYHQREIVHKSFERSFVLPTMIDAEKAVAEFKEGVLTLTMPMAEVVTPKKIPVAK